MQKNAKSLTPRQSRAVAHLLEAESVSEAAGLTGVSRTTLYAWLKKPHFRAELELARRADHQARLNHMRELLPKALVVLEGLLASNDERVRLKAAGEIIKANQALLEAEPTGSPLMDLGEEVEEQNLSDIARACVQRLLNGSLDAKAAQMLPSYLRLLERLKKEEAEIKSEEEEEREAMLYLMERTLKRDPTGDPLLQTWQDEVKEMLREGGADMEEIERQMAEAHAEDRSWRPEFLQDFKLEDFPSGKP